MKKNIIKITLLATICILIQGCVLGNFSALSKKKLEIEERARQNNQAALYLSQSAITNIVSLDLDNKQELIYPIEQSVNYLERNSLLLGLPAENQKNTVNQILSTNKQDRIKAEKKQKKDLDKEEDLVYDARKAKENLEGMGVLYEKEKNEEFWARVKWATIGCGALLLLGGIVALPFVFPALGGLLVGFAPSLSTLFRVVPKSTLENKVKGIAEIRATIKENIKLEDNVDSIRKEVYQEIYKMINEKLSKNEDNSDKGIIDYLRNKIE